MPWGWIQSALNPVESLLGLESDPDSGKVRLRADRLRCERVTVKNHSENSGVKIPFPILQTWAAQIIKPKLDVVCGRGQRPLTDAWLQRGICACRNQTAFHSAGRVQVVRINRNVCIWNFFSCTSYSFHLPPQPPGEHIPAVLPNASVGKK